MVRGSSRVKVARPHLRLYLLGSFRVERDSQPVHLPRRKVEALLAYLVLHPQAHSREKLASLFWGDFTDQQARKSLRTALPILRGELGDELLLVDRDAVQLNPAFSLWFDVREFERQATAFLCGASSDPASMNPQLYKGELLAEFYDDWILPERERLRTLYLETLARLIQQCRAQSEYECAMEFAYKALAIDRGNERVHQHLMFCCVALGNRQAALEQYDQCVHALREELDVNPAPETTALANWIKQTPIETFSDAARLTNLPIPLSSFIGRRREMAEIKQLLATTRLVTFAGAGGSGKTRLAIQVATDLLDSFKDGVWWVELGGLAEESLVPQQVAKALGVREAPNAPLVEMLASFLREKQLLLVIDNCEHVIGACARLAASLLGAGPNLKILATSREALRINGETVFQVPTLAVPPSTAALLSGDMECESVRLFVERARAAKSDFALTEQNARAIAQICQRLDGIPLAIELAVARTTLLTPEQIAARLDDRFNLLTHGSRAALPRQQTLRATIDWSYDLLSEEERVLFRRLAIFAGGGTLNATEAICAGEGIDATDVMDLLGRLIDQSLIVVDEQGGEMRYRFLETIRQYAREKLDASGETKSIRDRHLEFFRRFSEQAEPKIISAEQLEWLARVEAELENLRAAFTWAQADGSVEAGFCIAYALFHFWIYRVYCREVRERVEKLLAKPEAAMNIEAHAKGLLMAGVMAYFMSDFACVHTRLEQSQLLWQQLGATGVKGLAWTRSFLITTAEDADHDYALARRRYQDNLQLFQAADYPYGVADTIFEIGRAAMHFGDWAEARHHLTSSQEMFRAVGDNLRAYDLLRWLGYMAFREGNYAEARAKTEEALSYHQRTHFKVDIDAELWLLGVIAIRESDYVRARTHYAECLAFEQELGETAQLSECLIGFAGIAVAEQRFERAVRLLGAAKAQVEVRQVTMEAFDQAEYQRLANLLCRQVGEAPFNTSWNTGRTLTPERAMEYALETDEGR